MQEEADYCFLIKWKKKCFIHRLMENYWNAFQFPSLTFSALWYLKGNKMLDRKKGGNISKYIWR